MEAHPDATSWWTIGQWVGGAFFAIAWAFVVAYFRWKNEHKGTGEDIVQKSVGAAFVDSSASRDFRSIAEDVKALRQLAEGREIRFKEDELLKKLAEKLEKSKHPPADPHLPGLEPKG